MLQTSMQEQSHSKSQWGLKWEQRLIPLLIMLKKQYENLNVQIRSSIWIEIQNENTGREISLGFGQDMQKNNSYYQRHRKIIKECVDELGIDYLWEDDSKDC